MKRPGASCRIAGLLLLALCPAAQGARLEVTLVSHSTAPQPLAEIELSLRAETPDRAPIQRLPKAGSAPQGFDLAEGTWTIEARALRRGELEFGWGIDLAGSAGRVIARRYPGIRMTSSSAPESS